MVGVSSLSRSTAASPSLHDSTGFFLVLWPSAVSVLVVGVLLGLFGQTSQLAFPLDMADLDQETRPSCGPQLRLDLDQACLKINDVGGNNWTLWAQTVECQACPLLRVWPAPGHAPPDSHLAVNTTWPSRLQVRTDGDGGSPPTCNLTYHFEQYGGYELSFGDCDILIARSPANIYTALVYALAVLVGLRLVLSAARLVYASRKCRQFLMSLCLVTAPGIDVNDDLADERHLVTPANRDAASDSASSTSASLSPEERKRKNRIKSLDAFRGLAIAVMIFVNYGGGHYWFFNHSTWNGLTVADLVFPWFMWIMGVSLAVVMQSHVRNATPRLKIFKGVLRRSLILFLLGLFLNSSTGGGDADANDLRALRIPGVLQRFAIAYFAASGLEILFLSSSGGGVLAVRQWLVMLTVVGAHTGLTFFLPVPDCPTGYLGPGGLHDGMRHANCTGGAAGYIDRLVLGPRHIYQFPTARAVYATSVPYDPEGLLGCLTSLFLVFLGVQAGKTLMHFPEWKGRVKCWLGWSAVCGLAAGLLCQFSKEGGLIPVNKNLWSLSFVLATGAMAYFLFAAMYLLIDVFHVWHGSPFTFAGMNAILLYVGHEVCEGHFPFAWKPFTPTHTELLFMNLWGTGLWMLVAHLLFRAKFFLAL